MDRPTPDELHKVRAAQHSLDDMRADKGSGGPSGTRAHAAKNAKQKESLDKLAMHMSQRFDATAARDAARKVIACSCFCPFEAAPCLVSMQ